MAVASFQGFENDVLFGKYKTGIIWENIKLPNDN